MDGKCMDGNACLGVKTGLRTRSRKQLDLDGDYDSSRRSVARRCLHT